MSQPAITLLPSLAAWSLTGAGARDFLQGYVTSDLNGLQPDRWHVTAFCTIKGRVLATAYVTGSASEVTLVMPREMIDPLLASLKKFLAFARGCKLARSQKHVQGCIGHVPEHSDFTAVALPGRALLSMRLGHGKATDKDDVLWRWHEIEAGFAQVQRGTSESFLPQMLGLDVLGAVSDSKGCYLGQEVVTRASHRGKVKRRLVRASWRGEPEVDVGQTLHDSHHRERGVLVAFAPDPESPEKTDGLAVISGDSASEWQISGQRLQMDDSHNL